MKIKYKNFRCFKSTKDLELKKITLLVGENSSGKTSFLAGLNHIHGLIRGDANVHLNSDPFELGSFQDICYAPEEKKGQSFDYGCQIDKHLMSWSFENDQGAPRIQQHAVKRIGASASSYLIINEKGIEISLGLSKEYMQKLISADINVVVGSDGNGIIRVVKDLSSISNALRFGHVNYNMFFDFIANYFYNKMSENSADDENGRPSFFRTGKFFLLDDSDDSQERDKLDELGKGLYDLIPCFHVSEPIVFKKITVSDYTIRRSVSIAPLRSQPERVYSFAKSASPEFDPHGKHLAATILRLSKSKGWEEFSELLSDFGKKAGLFQEIRIEPLKKDSDYPFSIMVRTNNNQTSNFMDVGYGVSQILPLMCELLGRGEYSRYLIQQPEVHLHPRAQAEFATLVAKLIAEDANVFVIETHSDYMIDRLKYEIKTGTISHEDINILFFDPSGDGETIIHQIDLNKDGSPKDAPDSYRKFFLEEMTRNWDVE